MARIEKDIVPRKRRQIAEREIDGELLVVPVFGEPREKLPVVLLNATARFIWNSIDGSRDSDAIAELLCGRFAVDRARALSDTRDCLRSLARAGLLELR